MRPSSNSLRTVSFNIPYSSQDLTTPLRHEEHSEETTNQYIARKYTVHIMIGFIIIGSGITIGMLYLFRDK